MYINRFNNYLLYPSSFNYITVNISRKILLIYSIGYIPTYIFINFENIFYRIKKVIYLISIHMILTCMHIGIYIHHQLIDMV